MISTEDDRVLCRNPDPAKAGTRIDRWKYERMRQILLRVIPDGPPGVPFSELRGLVEADLEEQEADRLGSIGWYTTTVKLDLEARGEIERVPNSRPQRLVRGKPAS